MKNIKKEFERRRANNHYVREYIDLVNEIKFEEVKMTFIDCLGELTNMSNKVAESSCAPKSFKINN